MTLRLWSNDIFLGPIVTALGFQVEHLHFKGEQIAADGVLPGRRATHNYASIANAKGHDVADIVDWIDQTVAAVVSDEGLVQALRTGQIEAMFWITFFGRTPVPTPTLPASLVHAVANVGGRILLENYTDLGADCPTKIWLPDGPVHQLDERLT